MELPNRTVLDTVIAHFLHQGRDLRRVSLEEAKQATLRVIRERNHRKLHSPAASDCCRLLAVASSPNGAPI